MSRLKKDSNWSKILFRPDRKLQIEEINELQELINSQITKGFSTLYDFYTVVSGCKVLIQKVEADKYNCILTPGVVFIELEESQGYFIDIPSYNFSATKTEPTSIGVRFKVEELKDQSIFRNPHTGGSAFGSEGANRLTIKPEIVVSPKVLNNNSLEKDSKGFFPIAIIKPKSDNFRATNLDLSEGFPNIFYYRNEELTETFNENTVATNIKNVLDITFHEMAGNFISEGFYLSFNEKEKLVTISPGVAYVAGRRVETTSTITHKLEYEDPDSNDKKYEGYQYSYFITKLGSLDFSKDKISSIHLANIPKDSLDLGSLLFKGHRQQRGGPSYLLNTPRTRMPNVYDLLLLEQRHEKNKKDLANLVLLADLYNVTNGLNENLNGIFADSFNDLLNSDISNPLFDCSILPSIQAISLPFVSFSKNIEVISVDSGETESSLIGTRKNEEGASINYWATVSGNNAVVLSQPVISDSIVVDLYFPTSSNGMSSFSNPNVLYRKDTNSLVNYADPKIKDYIYTDFTNQQLNLDEISSKSIDATQILNTVNNNLVEVRTIIVEASGFPSRLDNIIVTVNSDILSNFTILEDKGAPGSSFGSVKASALGTVKISFTPPATIDSNVLDIRFSNGVYESTTEVVIEDNELNRIRREITGEYIDRPVTKYSTVSSGVAQTFQILKPTLITGVELFVVNVNNIFKDTTLNNSDILSVHLTRTIGGIDSNTPTDETIAYGTLSKTNLNLPIKGINHLPSTVIFDKPVNITETGTYALVIHTGIDQLELATNKVSNNNIKTGSIGSNQATDISGQLYIKDSQLWTATNDTDLTFNLLGHIPSSITSSISLVAENVEPYNLLDLNLPVELSDSGQVQVEVLDQGVFKILESGRHFYTENVNSSEIKITTIGTSNTHPIVDLDDINMNLMSHKSAGSWVSKNLEFDTAYTKIELSLELFKPNNSSFEVYISSNKGQTWENLSEINIDGIEIYKQSEEVVNALVPLLKVDYFKELNQFIQINNQDSERYNLMVRVDMKVSDFTNIPFFKNLIAITY